MSASTFPLPDHLACLVKRGAELAVLLREAKSIQEGLSREIPPPEISICEGVGEVIRELLGELERAEEDGGGGQLVEESIAYVKAKMEQTLLEQFIKVDPAHEGYYQELAALPKRAKTFKSQKRLSSIVARSGLPISAESSHHQADRQQGVASTNYDHSRDFDFEAKYDILTPEEKACLWCFSLFPVGVEIERRVLIYWWIALGLIDGGKGSTEGDEMLARFVEEGFIKHAMNMIRGNNYRGASSNCYTMNIAGIHSKLLDQEDWVDEGAVLKEEEPSYSIQELEKIRVLVNISEDTLDWRTFDFLSGLKNVQVLHLGSWHNHNHGTDYIVLEDIDLLVRGLKHVRFVRLLSLEGVSGIVELPDSVYKLWDLRVLDLRACHSLELLPNKGIESLFQLTHLDLSECYLLDHIPKGITSLSKLIVLKGFVVSPDHLENDQTSCAFSELRKLRRLTKLTIRTRRMNFPTTLDLHTLCQMECLAKLKVSWVGNSSDAPPQTYGRFYERFPHVLEKLELHAVPKQTASRLLRLIRQSHLCKLSIIGGEVDDLDPDGDTRYIGVTRLRLKYLSNLHMDWSECRFHFPHLSLLEILECPNLIDFPCDENGVWKDLVLGFWQS